MVSYPDTYPSSQSHRAPRSSRAPSVASSTTGTSRHHHRHHRSTRSHAGGGGGSSPSQPQNEFPIFTHTGDVEIFVAPPPPGRGERAHAHEGEQRFLLHRLILSQCSGFFEAGLSDEWAQGRNGGGGGQQGGGGGGPLGPVGQAAVARRPEKRRWMYELDWGNAGDEVPILVQKEPPQSLFGGPQDLPYNSPSRQPPPLRPKPAPPSSGFFRGLASNFSTLSVNTAAPSVSSASHGVANQPRTPTDDILLSYTNLFRIFYNYAPAIDTTNIANAYVECKALLAVADMYDALSVIGPRVDHHLLRFGSRLWKQIAKYPASYLKLGYLSRSRAIFAEAMVHVVGTWPASASQLKSGPGVQGVSLPVLDLIEDKVDELEELKAKVESKLWRLTLTTSRGERVTPANAWLDWLVISLWRQWFAENTTPGIYGILKGPPSSSGASTTAGGSTSRRISSRSSTTSHSRSNSIIRPSHSQQPSLAALAAPAPPLPLPPPLNTGRIFRLIGIGGSAYLSHDACKRFLKYSAPADSGLYNRENIRRFERRIEELKNLARDAVQPLMRNFAEGTLDAEESGRGRDGGYLTCIRLEEGEMLWDE
ncbi:hypothetical protein K402DRAFT_349409 [Aulographum hederae CBS 113979]|uniref:BTB domain-containing protein n=1 Tax=Aulographum hederae CBS 113979 TaxID=1176131 RepID=A0A6G1H903_9PEZI|nr:hypothetical protein K402DRAFT_349409 [Aulographum hederae CBS 113979]